MGASENEVLEGGHSQFTSSNMSVPFFFFPPFWQKRKGVVGSRNKEKKLWFFTVQITRVFFYRNKNILCSMTCGGNLQEEQKYNFIP